MVVRKIACSPTSQTRLTKKTIRISIKKEIIGEKNTYKHT